MDVLIIDTETTGLEGFPQDRVLEIGITEYVDGVITPLYNEIIRYDDMMEYNTEYERRHQEPIWVYSHTDMTLDDTLNAEKDLLTVSQEVRDICYLRCLTSYNVPFDFKKFLNWQPWHLSRMGTIPFDIMDMATERVYELVHEDKVEDKALQRKILDEEEFRPGKWIRSLDAYRILCPEDPAGRKGEQSHRALDDTIQEAYILRALDPSQF